MESSLPQNWIEVNFTEVLDVQGGTQPPKSTFIYNPQKNYVQLLQIRDFGGKPLSTYIPFKSTLKFCKKDDVLIARYGASLGRIVSGLEGAYNVALAKVIIPKGIDKKYVNYLLKSEIFQRPILANERSAQDGFNKDDLAKINIPLAPLPEQQRIVAKLDALMEKIERSRVRLEKIPIILKRFRQSILSAAVSGKLTEEWRERNSVENDAGVFLSQIHMIRKDRLSKELGLYKSKKGKKPRRSEEDLIPITRADEKYPETWRVTRIRDICDCLDSIRKPINKDERSKRLGSIPYYGANGQVGWIDDYLFDEDLVVVVEDETFIGREIPFSYIIRGKTWVNNHAHVLRPMAGMSVDYLNSCLAYYNFTPLTSGTTGRRKLNQGALMEAELPIAPLKEQEEIVRAVTELFSLADKIEARYNKAKSQLDKLPQSLLAKAFRGELVAQDPNDEPASELLERIGGSAIKNKAKKYLKMAKQQ